MKANDEDPNPIWSVSLKEKKPTLKLCTQKKGHMRTPREGNHLQTRKRVLTRNNHTGPWS